MFEVIFEVCPKASQWDSYLNIAKGLKPEIAQIRGFQDNVRFKSLTRPGWLLSLSDWEDEKALVRWRTQMKHHKAQEKGRDQVFSDYHLRIGEVFSDSGVEPAQDGQNANLKQIRFDETEVGAAKTITLVTGQSEGGYEPGQSDLSGLLKTFNFDESAKSQPGLVQWDIFEAILTPGTFLLLCAWQDPRTAESGSSNISGNAIDRTRQVRIVRDYGMFDRREAPQYYPEKERA